jgi:hypothetical protein
MGVEAAARTYFPATQDSSKAVANSRRCNPQSDQKSEFGQVQTHKVTPEALSLFTFQQDAITNEREEYPSLATFSDQPVIMWTYAGHRRVKNTIKR